MALAICLQCGTERKHAIGKCPRCGFQPSTNEAKAKSLILSEYFDAGEECYGRSREELRAIARDIQSGRQPVFDDKEVRKMVAEVRAFESITGKDLLIDGIKWLAPPLGLLLALWLPHFWFG